MHQPPAHLDGIARAEWLRLVPILERMRVIGDADYVALSTLCCDLSIAQQTQEAITKSGLLTKDQSGRITQNPLLALLDTTNDRVMRGLREFGLTPATRKLISVADHTLGEEVPNAPGTPLKNPRWERFCQFFVANNNITQSFIAAGFSPRTAGQAGSALLKKLQVSTRVAELRAYTEKSRVIKSELSKTWVIEMLKRNAKRAMQLDDGNVVNRALELLGKEIGMFVDRKQLRVGRLSDLSDDELATLLGDASAQLVAAEAAQDQAIQ